MKLCVTKEGTAVEQQVSKVSEDEFRRLLKRMSGEAVVPDDKVAIAVIAEKNSKMTLNS